MIASAAADQRVPLDTLESLLKLLARKEEETRELTIQLCDLKSRIAELEGGQIEYAPAEAPDASHMARRLLVVDSSDAFLEQMAGILDKAGFLKVDLAHSGRRAVELAAEHDYDLIFLDYKLSDVSGVETLRELRELRPQAKIVVVTAEVLKYHILECLRCGADDFISKPIAPAVLIRRALRCLSGTC